MYFYPLCFQQYGYFMLLLEPFILKSSLSCPVNLPVSLSCSTTHILITSRKYELRRLQVNKSDSHRYAKPSPFLVYNIHLHTTYNRCCITLPQLEGAGGANIKNTLYSNCRLQPQLVGSRT